MIVDSNKFDGLEFNRQSNDSELFKTSIQRIYYLITSSISQIVHSIFLKDDLMLRSNKILKPSPSIHNIIIEQQETKLNNQIKQFFKSKHYPTFPIGDLLDFTANSSDQRFYLLVRQLQDWNKKVQRGEASTDSRAELYRNKFVFTSLKNLLLSSSKGSAIYQTNLSKLYEWWRKNSKEKIPMYLTTRKKTKQEEEWQVRKTFKTNMPLDLKNYQRRALFTSQQDLNYLHTTKQKQTTDDKLVDYVAIKEFNSKQIKLREAREQEEIENGKTLLKQKKSRFLQDNCHNKEFYKGNFNQASKTAFLFNSRKNHQQTQQINKVKSSNSFSLMDKEKEEIHKIKKYRFNSALSKKVPILPQRDLNLNKTSKTFLSSKPLDATVEDFGGSMLTARKEILLTKQISIGIDLIESAKQQNFKFLRQDKQNTNSEFFQFMELRNWDGQRLISNPFDKKKQLKQKKKKLP